MRVQIVVDHPKSGISYHRLVNPMQNMVWGPDDSIGIIWDTPGSKVTIDCDILVYNKHTYIPISILKDHQANGMKIVVDVDDYWHLSENHVNYSAWKEQDHSQKIEEHIKLADLVTCTSMLLQDKVRELNKNTAVIPNALVFSTRTNHIPHDKMTFMYMGGCTHLPDVRLLEPTFRKCVADTLVSRRAVFIMAGYERGQQLVYRTEADRLAKNDNYIIQDQVDSDSDKMADIFRLTKGCKILPSAPLTEYIDYYNQADVALCPLIHSEWNSCKSVLKAVEAGLKNIPIMCPRVPPYYTELQDCPGIIWVDEDNWLNAIRWCIKNPEQVTILGDMLYTYMRRKYNLLDWNKVRYTLYKNLLG